MLQLGSSSWATMWKKLPHLSFKDHHEIPVNENDFHLRMRLSCEKDSHLRKKLLKYKCEVKFHI